VPVQDGTVEQNDKVVEYVTTQDAALLIKGEISALECLSKEAKIEPYDRGGTPATVESNQFDFLCLLTRHSQALHGRLRHKSDICSRVEQHRDSHHAGSSRRIAESHSRQRRRRIKEDSVVGLQSGVLDDFFHEEGGLLRASQPGTPDVSKRWRGFSLGNNDIDTSPLG
jgi:hypothetical protein